MAQLELRALPLNLDDEQGESTLSGVVNVPGSQSEILTNPISGKQFREVIEPGTFAKALENAKSVDLLYQHDKEKILSTTDNGSLDLHEDDESGLVMSAKITQTSWGKDAYQMIKDGIVRSMSFGMNVIHDTWLKGADGIPLRIIDEINLIEVSAVRNPAYAASAIEARGIDITEVEIPNMEERDLAQSEASEEERSAWADNSATVAPTAVTVSFDDDAKALLQGVIDAVSSFIPQTEVDVEDRDDTDVVDDSPDDSDSSDDSDIEDRDGEVVDSEAEEPEERSLSDSQKKIFEFFN